MTVVNNTISTILFKWYEHTSIEENLMHQIKNPVNILFLLVVSLTYASLATYE